VCRPVGVSLTTRWTCVRRWSDTLLVLTPGRWNAPSLPVQRTVASAEVRALSSAPSLGPPGHCSGGPVPLPSLRLLAPGTVYVPAADFPRPGERERAGEQGRAERAMAESNPLRGFPRLRRAAVSCAWRSGRWEGGEL